MAVRQLWGSGCRRLSGVALPRRGAQKPANPAWAGHECLRGFCSSVGAIRVNNIPEWAPPQAQAAAVENRFPLPYRDCTILKVLESVDMSGRADCRQGKCRKCAVNVRVNDNSEVYEVLSCQEVAVDGLVVDLPDGWQPKPKWADPHPEKLRITTRELKAAGKLRTSAALGRRLKAIVTKGNFAFKKEKWAEAMKSIDDIDETISKCGFSQYVEFQMVSTLARDLVPDFLVALSITPRVVFFPNAPQEVADKARDLADVLKEHLEEAGTSAAAFNADMDENTIGSHGVGKKGAATEGLDGGAGGLSGGAFYRNFSIWPEFEERSFLPSASESAPHPQPGSFN